MPDAPTVAPAPAPRPAARPPPPPRRAASAHSARRCAVSPTTSRRRLSRPYRSRDRLARSCPRSSSPSSRCSAPAGARRPRRSPRQGCGRPTGLGDRAGLSPLVATILYAAVLVIGGFFPLVTRTAAADGARPTRPTGALARAGGTAVGLIHGLGFAGTLRALGLPDGHLGGALVGFNLGLELAHWPSSRARPRRPGDPPPRARTLVLAPSPAPPAGSSASPARPGCSIAPSPRGRRRGDDGRAPAAGRGATNRTGLRWSHAPA